MVDINAPRKTRGVQLKIKQNPIYEIDSDLEEDSELSNKNAKNAKDKDED